MGSTAEPQERSSAVYLTAPFRAAFQLTARIPLPLLVRSFTAHPLTASRTTVPPPRLENVLLHFLSTLDIHNFSARDLFAKRVSSFLSLPVIHKCLGKITYLLRLDRWLARERRSNGWRDENVWRVPGSAARNRMSREYK